MNSRNQINKQHFVAKICQICHAQKVGHFNFPEDFECQFCYKIEVCIQQEPISNSFSKKSYFVMKLNTKV